MPETQKTRKKRVRTAPFPLPPEKLEQVRVERERRGEALPTTFTEDECHFVLHISQQITPFDYTGPRPEYDWQWYGSTFMLSLPFIACFSSFLTRRGPCIGKLCFQPCYALCQAVEVSKEYTCFSNLASRHLES